MVRHTGDYLLGTMFLAAALILQLSQAHEHSAAKLPPHQSVANSASNSRSATSSLSVPDSRLHETPSPSVHTVLKSLPRGTRIVVGSLDLSGARHQVRLTSRKDEVDVSNDTSIEVARFTTESVRRILSNETNRGLSHRVRSRRNHRLIQTTALELQPDETEHSETITNAVYRPAFETITASDRLVSNIDISANSKATAENEGAARVFLMPHFNSAGTVHKPGECQVIAESQRVLVYLDQSLPQTSSSQQMQDWCELLISVVELKALPTVERWIGSICDIDSNEKLSIVITDLDQYEMTSTTRTPVFGCIREADFCTESDFSGDIVYIDQHIFELPVAEVCGILGHEISHAAMCSINHQSTLPKTADSQQNTPFYVKSPAAAVQPWLNEAVAHFIELQCGEQANSSPDEPHEVFTENFKRRINAFLASSGVSPIVASEDVLNMEERRNGSRGAATLFLAPLISSPPDLQALICGEDSLQDRIENLAQEPFADVFRSWTLSVAATKSETDCLRVEKIERALESQHYSILGTAFQCFECSDDIETLVLTSGESAQLQVSIIEPAALHERVARTAVGESGTSVPSL